MKTGRKSTSTMISVEWYNMDRPPLDFSLQREADIEMLYIVSGFKLLHVPTSPQHNYKCMYCLKKKD